MNASLPEQFFAETQVHLGSHVEADVVEFEHAPGTNGVPGGLALATYAPPRPVLTFPGPIEDDVSVEVRDRERDSRVAAVVELLSRDNKDREEARRGFAAKMVRYLRASAGLMVIDVLTSQRAMLHNELVALLNLSVDSLLDSPTGLSIVSYQPSRQAENSPVQVWFEPLALNAPLPTMPLSIRGFGAISIDVEGTYTQACKHSRLV